MEIVPVLQIEKDISIAGAADIKFFSFPSDAIGYAASEQSFIYKTVDGGQSWIKVPVASSGQCKGLEFFDVQNGMCLIDREVFVTANGGQSWTLKSTSDFIGITQEGIGVIGSNCSYNTHCLYSTANKGQSFTFLGSVKVNREFAIAKVTGNKLYLLPDNVFNENEFFGIDVKTKVGERVALENLRYFEDPSDIMVNDYMGLIVGSTGLFMERREDFSPATSFYSRGYAWNKKNYHSIDGQDALAVGVGSKVISVNLDFGKGGTWNELIGTNGTSFSQTFYKVKFVGLNSFYISGENGLLWKAKI